MKKLYTALLAACTLFAASATAPGLTTVGKTQLNKIGLTKEVNLEETIAVNADAAITRDQLSSDVKKIPSLNTWKSIGQGVWYEDLMTIYSFIESGQSWEVDIEESSTTPGLYRIQPYMVEGNPVAAAVEETDGVYFYIDATDPNNVYISEDASPYGAITFSQLVPENGWGTYSEYATLKNNVISFHENSFAFTQDNVQWNLCPMGGSFKIALPGAVVKDYSIKIQNESCNDENIFTFNLTLGADVAGLKAFIGKGEYGANQENYQYIAENGQSLSVDKTVLDVDLSGDDAPEGIYTLMLVTLDDNGDFCEGARSLFFVVKDVNADDWITLNGKAKYTDDIVGSIYTKLVATTAHEVTVQENKNVPGYYRLVNPYADPYEFAEVNTHSATHNHYLYINASNPEKVYIEECPIGFEGTDGAMTVKSQVYAGVDEDPELTDEDKAEISALWGKMKDNVITFPKKALVARELNYQNAGWYYANTNGTFKVDLNGTSGLGSIEAVDNNAPVEYFNLQGQRVSNPAAGQLMIKRQGTKVSKVVVR